jgi:membrane protein required for colicin V production
LRLVNRIELNHGGIAARMNGADYLIIGVLAFSMLLGLFRGFVRESIALLAWLGGLWLAWRYAPLVEPLFREALEEPASLWAARAIIVISVLILGWLLAALLSYFLRHSALSIMVDRLLGMFFGVVRGAVVIAVVIFLAQFAQLEQTSWWKNSRLLPYAVEAAGWIETFAETGMEALEAQAQVAQSHSSMLRG